MNEIDEALEWFKNYALPALSNTPHDIGHALVIKNTLTAAKEREAVDVEGCEGLVRKCQSFIEGKYKENNCNVPPVNSPDIRLMVNYLSEQGHLTSSEKPTHSIPEGMCLVPVELTEGIRRCIENLMFAYGYDGEPIPELEDKFYKALIKTAKSEGE